MTFAVELPIFTSILSMGTAGEEFKVVLDTGSDWTVVAGSNCTTCSGNTFDPDVSGTTVNQSPSIKLYGSAILEGMAY